MSGFIILVFVGALYFGYGGGSSADEDGEIKTATVTRGDIAVTVTGTGQIHAKSQVNLQGVAAGDGIDVVEVAVSNDQQVKEDDLIAVLDTTEPMKDVRNAQLSLQTALISQKETDRQYDNQTVEEKWKRQTEEVNVQQKQLSLSDAQSDLEDYYIRAPFDGIVTGLSVEVGDSVSQDDIIASVITKEMYAEISLNEVDAAKVQAGNKVTLTFDALPELSITGEISKIDTIGEVVQNVVSYDAEVSFEATSEFLKPGMSVDAEIAIDFRKDVLQISSSAIKTADDGSSYVQLMSTANAQTGRAGEESVRQFKVIRQTVETGLTDDVVTEVTSGLEEGDIIITKMSTATSAEESETSSILDSLRMRGPGGRGGGGRP